MAQWCQHGLCWRQHVVRHVGVSVVLGGGIPDTTLTLPAKILHAPSLFFFHLDDNSITSPSCAVS
jgi:hypothetical protein